MVQHVPLLVDMTLIFCFSILYRIEGGATRRERDHPPTPLVFQYPLSDRGWCNPYIFTAEKLAKFSFSILYRIEGGATYDPAAATHYASVFQYPLSDRGWCNVYIEYIRLA